MRKILAFTLLIMILAGSAWAQPTPPATPPSPASQGIQIPQASTSSQSPPSSESDQALTATTAASARAAAPSYGSRVGSGTYASTYDTYDTYGTSGPSSTYMIIPPGVSSANRFYIPYSPSTVAGCNFGQWLPMWLDVRGSGPLYMYEWYPNGRLVSNYLAYIRYPGWQKMWFNGDAAGWHILQYYCNGWSNYIYVYVYGSSNYPPYGQGYYPQPSYPTYPQTPTPGCNAQITITSNYRRGYSVSVDGSYIGGDGRRGDHFDGTFTFTVTGNQPHNIRIYSDGFSYTRSNTYNCGRTYNLYI